MTQLSLRPSLALPNSAPGWNPNHIASGGTPRFSGVSIIPGSAGFLNVLNGQRGVRTGTTPSGGYDGVIGSYFSTGGSGQYSAFAGFAGVEPTGQYTFAAITRQLTNSNSAIFSNDSSGTNGISFGVSSGNTWLVQCTNNSSFKTILGANRQVGVPYFGCISFNGTTTNAVQTNLITGQIHSTTTASAITVAGSPNGTYQVGAGFTHDNNSPIAAVMFSGNYMSQAELIYWAQAPWSYWYPDEATGDEVGLAQIIAALKAGNLMTMGVG